jgi:hypothetical protein
MRPLRILLLFLSGLLLLPAVAADKHFIDWQHLTNPVLQYPNWSIKDAAMAFRNGTFYVFFSAFYDDRGRVRSHVVEVSTRDFETYSDPIFNIDGREDGWIGLCSPDVQQIGGTYYMTFNSWGDMPDKPNQLFYESSPDLVHWSDRKSLAPNLTSAGGVIDAAVAGADGGFYLTWRGEGHGPIVPYVAFAKSMDGPWALDGSGIAAVKMPDGKDNGSNHENFEFLKINGTWRLLTSDYPPGHQEYLYTQEHAHNWLEWSRGQRLDVAKADYNSFIPCDAAAIYDWRAHDGYFYLLCAGRAEATTYLGRGYNRLALHRSKDLVHWLPAGAMR